MKGGAMSPSPAAGSFRWRQEWEESPARRGGGVFFLARRMAE
jgi:hypothetical protein